MSTLEETMAAIAQLWGDERCTLELQYIPAFYGNAAEHTVVLEWLDESGWLDRDCTYLTWRWQFNAAAFAEAAVEALEWVTALKVWEQCGECNALGVWDSKTCEHCQGTGLANA